MMLVYTPEQQFDLQRLLFVLDRKPSVQFASKLRDWAIYSFYRDCQRDGVGEEARHILGKYRGANLPEVRGNS